MTASERIREARSARKTTFTTDYVDTSGEWITFATSRTWDDAHSARVELRAALGPQGRIRITGP